MAPRKRTLSKLKEVKDTSTETPPFHLMFPFTLSHKEGKYTKYCYFQAEEHLIKYIKRLKLRKRQFIVSQTKPRNAS